MDIRFLLGLVLGFLLCLLTVTSITWVTDMLRKLICIIPILVIAGLIFPFQTTLQLGDVVLSPLPQLTNAEQLREVQLFIKLPSGTSLIYHGKRGSTVGDVMDFVTARTFITFTPDSPFRISAADGSACWTERSTTLQQCHVQDAQHVYVLGRVRGGGPKRPASQPSGE